MGAVGWNIMCAMHTIEMSRRGVLEENMYAPPMHRNIQKGESFYDKLAKHNGIIAVGDDVDYTQEDDLFPMPVKFV
jgi:hypothetical protein